MIKKILSYIVLLSGCTVFACIDPAAAVSEAGRHISNRIKIERPGMPVAPEVKEIKPEMPLTTEPELIEAPAARPEPVTVKSDVPEKPEKAVAVLAVEDLMASQVPGRFYSRKGRTSPFEPFLFSQESDATPTEQEQLQIRAPQTPLEKMDLSQVRLTGILRAAGKTRALVEEASGKGYVINEGTFIGNKGGHVSKILPDRVIVEEKYLDIYGKIAVREKELKLQN